MPKVPGKLSSSFLLSGSSSAWDTFTPVGYPALLAVVYALGGDGAVVGVVQAALGVTTALIMSALALRCFGRPALGLGLACALHVHSISYTGFSLTETLFAFLLASVCWLTCWAQRRGSPVAGALLGLVLGCAATVRPNVLLLPFLPVLLWIACERRGPSALLALAVVLGGFSLPVSAAALRNGAARACAPVARAASPAAAARGAPT